MRALLTALVLSLVVVGCGDGTSSEPDAADTAELNDQVEDTGADADPPSFPVNIYQPSGDDFGECGVEVVADSAPPWDPGSEAGWAILTNVGEVPIDVESFTSGDSPSSLTLYECFDDTLACEGAREVTTPAPSMIPAGETHGYALTFSGDVLSDCGEQCGDGYSCGEVTWRLATDINRSVSVQVTVIPSSP